MTSVDALTLCYRSTFGSHIYFCGLFGSPGVGVAVGIVVGVMLGVVVGVVLGVVVGVVVAPEAFVI